MATRRFSEMKIAVTRNDVSLAEMTTTGVLE
jgi:hypothetical protein